MLPQSPVDDKLLPHNGRPGGGRICVMLGGEMSHGMANPDGASVENLRAHVQLLAGDIGERNLFQPGTLERTAAYLERVWAGQGYAVTPYPFTVNGTTCRNLEVSRRGTGLPDQIVLLGAHYDTVDGSPGANDNGTGIAALLEISRRLARVESKRTVRFVAFVNEEPPFFQTAEMGSRVYARLARRRGDDVRAMLALETMGYFRDQPGSQQYPPLFRWFYPDRGNFIMFVSNLGSRSLLGRAVRAFRARTDFPAQRCATWASVPGVGWSDHASFWAEGYPAVMVTDTAPLRYPFYHTPEDTPDKVDAAALARVTAGLFGVVDSLANE